MISRRTSFRIRSESSPQNSPTKTGPVLGVPESPKILTPRQLARILWDFAYLCWANPRGERGGDKGSLCAFSLSSPPLAGTPARFRFLLGAASAKTFLSNPRRKEKVRLLRSGSLRPNDPKLRQRAAEFLRKQGKEDSLCRGS